MLPLACVLPGAAIKRGRILAGGPSLLATGFIMAMSIALYAQGLLRGEVAREILLFYLKPVWSTLLAWWMLGHRITRDRILTICSGWRECSRCSKQQQLTAAAQRGGLDGSALRNLLGVVVGPSQTRRQYGQL
jgi:hypothetical protein